MLGDSRKISLRQAAILFLTITFTPSIRVIPVYAAERAKQAAWISPIIGVLSLIFLVLIWQNFYRKYKDVSLMEIYTDITGKVVGTVLSIIYLVWLIALTALYVRYFAIRLVGSVYPNMSLDVFIIPMLVLIAYTMRRGITILSRFNEIAFPLLAIIFYILVILMLPNFKPKFLTPITYRDIAPVFNGSIGTIGILAYFTFLFIIGDKINNKERIKKTGFAVVIFMVIALVSIVAMTLGTFSYSVVSRTRLPFLIAVKQISLFNTIEKIESIVVAFWIISDYVLISFMAICTLHVTKYLHKLSEIKPLISVHMVFVYIVSMYLAKSVFEMEVLSEKLFIPGNIILGYIIPIIVFTIGKLRKKI